MELSIELSEKEVETLVNAIYYDMHYWERRLRIEKGPVSVVAITEKLNRLYEILEKMKEWTNDKS